MSDRLWKDLDSALLRRALSAHANLPVEPEHRAAAVCVLLVADGAGVRVLLIRRASRANDPWSGHMALPGGFHSPADADLYATVLRETLEEVAVDLEHGAEFIGCLSDVTPVISAVTVRPFVFVRREVPEIVTNEEVEAFVWTDVGAIDRGDAHGTFEISNGSIRQSFPGFSVGERVVWGLTYRVLMDLLERTRRTALELENTQERASVPADPSR